MRASRHSLRHWLCKPHVFADNDAKRYTFHHKGAHIGIRGEIAALIEYRVIWQFAFVVAGFDAAILNDAGGVENHRANGARRWQYHANAVNAIGNMLQGLLAIQQKTRPQQQIFWRIAAQRQLRKQQNINLLLLGLFNQMQNFIGVGRNGANRKIELRQGDAECVVHVAIVLKKPNVGWVLTHRACAPSPRMLSFQV